MKWVKVLGVCVYACMCVYGNVYVCVYLCVLSMYNLHICIKCVNGKTLYKHA